MYKMKQLLSSIVVNVNYKQVNGKVVVFLTYESCNKVFEKIKDH